MSDEVLVLNIAEAGRLLGLSRTTAYLMARRGLIPTLQFGKRKVVPKQALLKMLAQAQVKEQTRG